MRPHQGSVEGKENLPRPAVHTLLDAPQDPIGFLGSLFLVFLSWQLCLVGLFLEKALFGCAVRRDGIWEVRPRCCHTLGAWAPLSPTDRRADA